MQFRKVTIAAGALVVAGALGTGAYELTSGGDHSNPANPAAATTSSPDNGGTTGTNSSGGATLTQGGGAVTSGSASHGTMTSSGSQQTPPPPPAKPKGLLDNPVAKKIAETQVYK
jgi:hypothetical protein